jgi:hypothetical protein
MIIWPLYTPTQVEAKLEASKATAKSAATTAPADPARARWADSMEAPRRAQGRAGQHDRDVHARRQEHGGQHLGPADLQQPPHPAPAGRPHPGGQPGVQVHHVRHHGRPDDPGRQVRAAGAGQPGHQPRPDLGDADPGDQRRIDEADPDHAQGGEDHRPEQSVPAHAAGQHDAGRHHHDHRTGRQRQPDQQVQRDRPADDLGQVGHHHHDLGLQPHGQPDRGRHRTAAVLGQVAPGDQAELARQVLHQDSHGTGRDHHPQQRRAEAGARRQVGGHVARIHVGDGGQERRPQRGDRKPPPDRPGPGPAQVLRRPGRGQLRGRRVTAAERRAHRIDPLTPILSGQ